MANGPLRTIVDHRFEFGLAMAGIVSAGFYALLYCNFNSAPRFDGITIAEPAEAYRLNLDKCERNGRQIWLSGWLAKAGVSRKKHSTTAVIRDESTGLIYVMKTDLPPRPDVTQYLNKALGDQLDYDSSGFSASLDLAATGGRIRAGAVYVAFQQGNQFTLIPTSCAFTST
jgi:hypothetical protein